MVNMMVVITLMLCYNIMLVLIIKRTFNKLLKLEFKISRYMRNIDELNELSDSVKLDELKDVISYCIDKLKRFIKSLKNG